MSLIRIEIKWWFFYFQKSIKKYVVVESSKNIPTPKSQQVIPLLLRVVAVPKIIIDKLIDAYHDEWREKKQTKFFF